MERMTKEFEVYEVIFELDVLCLAFVNINKWNFHKIQFPYELFEYLYRYFSVELVIECGKMHRWKEKS